MPDTKDQAIFRAITTKALADCHFAEKSAMLDHRGDSAARRAALVKAHNTFSAILGEAHKVLSAVEALNNPTAP